MVAWERSRGCCTLSATADTETMKLCLLALISAAGMALLHMQTSLGWKMCPGRCTDLQTDTVSLLFLQQEVTALASSSDPSHAF